VSVANVATASDGAEAGIAGIIRDAAASREPLLIEGHGTKASMLRPVQAARTLSTAGLSGINLYAPKELIISAWAGTPLPEIEAALAAGGQHLIAEPPDLSGLLGDFGRSQTLGGVVATNLSGPRRVAWGAMRDHVMGVRAVTGRAEVIRSGGRVLKNVTGLDLCKLLTGSHGTLGVITEITLKVLPAPEATGTLVLPGLDAVSGVAALSAALGSPYGVSAAAWLPDDGVARVPGLEHFRASAALVRIEEFTPSVAYRLDRLRQELAVPGATILDDQNSRGVWKAIRDAQPLAPQRSDAVWRVSVRPSAGPSILAALRSKGASGFLDWGGGLVWLAGPAETQTHAAIEAAAQASGGTWTLMRAPDTLRGSVRVVPDEPSPLARITREVKAALDPAGILNPGRFYAGL
jgi:glycolate oxidase FAD binding subunit